MSSFKIAIIGAGSIGFTKKLFSDILCVPEFADVEFALTDISQHNLDMIEKILNRTVSSTSCRPGSRRPPIGAGDRGRALRDQLRARRRARGLCRRHSHPAEIWRRPVRRRHDLRRRHSLRPAQHSGHPRLLQGHQRGGRAGREVPELCQPDGDEHLGGDRIWQGQHDRPLPWRAARRATDRRSARRRRRRTRLCLLRHQSPDLVHRHPAKRPQDREGRADRRLRGAPGLFQAGEGAHRRAEALRRLFHREQRPPREYLPWYRKRPDEIARWIDMSRLDPRRDRRLSPPLDRDPQLVRDRISAVPGGGRQADRSSQPFERACQPHHRGAGDRPRLSRPFQRPQQRHHHQPAAPTRSSKSPGFVDRFGINMVAGITLPEACAATCCRRSTCSACRSMRR